MDTVEAGGGVVGFVRLALGKSRRGEVMLPPSLPLLLTDVPPLRV